MIKLIYIFNAILIVLLLMTFKNLFSGDVAKSYSTAKLEKELKQKNIAEITVAQIPKLSAREQQNLKTSVANIFNYNRVYPKNPTVGKKATNTINKAVASNLEKKIDAELKKIELLGIICYNGKKVATIKFKTKTIRNNKSKSGKTEKETMKLKPNPTQSYQENDTLSNGFKVIEIKKSSVILAKGGYKKTLKIVGSK